MIGLSNSCQQYIVSAVLSGDTGHKQLAQCLVGKASIGIGIETSPSKA